MREGGREGEWSARGKGVGEGEGKCKREGIGRERHCREVKIESGVVKGGGERDGGEVNGRKGRGQEGREGWAKGHKTKRAHHRAACTSMDEPGPPTGTRAQYCARRAQEQRLGRQRERDGSVLTHL